MGKEREKLSPNALGMIRLSTLLTYWYEKSVCEAENFEERVAIFTRIVDILMVGLCPLSKSRFRVTKGTGVQNHDFLTINILMRRFHFSVVSDFAVNFEHCFSFHIVVSVLLWAFNRH